MTKDIDQKIGLPSKRQELILDDPDEKLPKSYTEARVVGAKHYFTGKMCKNGHIAKRTASNGSCIECANEKMRRLRINEEYVVQERARAKDKRDINPEAARVRLRDHRNNDLEWARTREREWYAKNIEKQREIARYKERKKRSTAKGQLDSNMSRAIRGSLQVGVKSRRSWQSLVGYTVSDLKEHLERQFQPGMSWENYGKWHIDHIIPLAAHNYDTAEAPDFQKAWALSNLRPLWAVENMSKGAKLIAPFQPSLSLHMPVNDNVPTPNYARVSAGLAEILDDDTPF